MNVSETFIRRPIATSLVMLALAVFGAIAYRALPVADLPTVAYPAINVSASLPGADAITMASSVASPLERQFTTIAGVDSMTSSSSNGSTSIALQFDLARDVDSAASDIQAAIAAAMPLLPPGMPAPPSFRKSNPADDPIIFISLTSPTLPMYVVDEYAETLLVPRLSVLNGVGQVQVQGAQKYAVRVQVDPDKLKADQISLNEVDQALQNWNVNLPTGQLFGRSGTVTIAATGQLMNAAAFRPMVVAYRNGVALHLEDIAHVIDSVEDNKNLSWVYTKNTGSQPAIHVAVRAQANANTIEVADAVRKLLPTFEAQLPPSVHLVVRGDRSKTIREAFHDLQITMLVTLALVVGVIFVFLRNGSATVIPSLALPFSILGTFAVMLLLGFTLDNLSMMAIILSIGFVVDDAIVMIENIMRHMEEGRDALDAALTGSKEIGFTILSMTVSLAAAFIPILFMTGVLGRVFREFAVTITTAILISGVVSVTLTPMLCSRFLHVPGRDAARAFPLMASVFDLLHRGYARSLRVVLRHRMIMAGVFVAVLAVTMRMYSDIPKGLVPDQDIDAVNINVRAAQGTSFYEMVGYAQAVARVVRDNPNVDAYQMSVAGGSGSSNAANLSVQLTPRATRSVSATDIAQQIRQPLQRFAGFRTTLTLPPAIVIGSRRTAGSYSVLVQSASTDQLYDWAGRLNEAMTTLPEIQDVADDVEMKTPRVALDIDRDKAAVVGLDAQQIENTLYDGLGAKWSTTMYGPVTQYHALLELDPQYQQYTDSLKSMTFKTASGVLIPLESVVHFRETVGPQSINHAGQLPAAAISFGLRPVASLGAAVQRITAVAGAILPDTVSIRFEGSAKVFQTSLTDLAFLLCVAIGVVYIVLGMLYESYVHPLTILSGLPSAGLGALVTLRLFGNQLNIYSFVGLVMLIGIVKKNAIMQIDVALIAERQHGKSPVDAIYEGCLTRFRPIMMTTMAALFGALPIALGLGAGGEARRPLGLAIVGGLIVSQLVTLYLTPVVYTSLASLVRTRPIRAM